MPTTSNAPAVRSDASGIEVEMDGISIELAFEAAQDGKRVYRMQRATHAQRGIIPGLPVAALLSAMTFRSTGGSRAEARAAEGPPADDDPDGEIVVEGIASSTSQDWYGTEMDRDALEGMARQFNAGVALTPRHNGWYEPVEWDEVIGLTLSATVKAEDVVNPADAGEQGYTLAIRAKLFASEEKAQTLARRLRAEQPIGLSIGGWFTDVRIITDQDDEIERIIVMKVSLDHLAVTRAPANPDSTGLRLFRSISTKAVKALAVRSAPEAPAPLPAEAAEAAGGEGYLDAGNSGQILDESAPMDDAATNNEGTSPDPTCEDRNMPLSAEDIARIAAEAAVRAIAGTQSAPAQTAAAPAPAAPAASGQGVDWESRARSAEAQRDAAQAQVRQMAGRSSPGRRTSVPNHAYEPGTGDGSQIRSLAALARDEGRALALAEVTDRQERVLGADRYDPTISRSELENCLRQTIRAAEQDGYIRDPSSEGAWA